MAAEKACCYAADNCAGNVLILHPDDKIMNNAKQRFQVG